MKSIFERVEPGIVEVRGKFEANGVPVRIIFDQVRKGSPWHQRAVTADGKSVAFDFCSYLSDAKAELGKFMIRHGITEVTA